MVMPIGQCFNVGDLKHLLVVFDNFVVKEFCLLVVFVSNTAKYLVKYDKGRFAEGRVFA